MYLLASATSSLTSKIAGETKRDDSDDDDDKEDNDGNDEDDKDDKGDEDDDNYNLVSFIDNRVALHSLPTTALGISKLAHHVERKPGK
jgi:hypothetical protein